MIEETRRHEGVFVIRREVGRVYVVVVCPFCGNNIGAFLWSLCGSGKKCDCGAVVFRFNAYLRKQDDGCY